MKIEDLIDQKVFLSKERSPGVIQMTPLDSYDLHGEYPGSKVSLLDFINTLLKNISYLEKRIIDLEQNTKQY